MKCLAFIFIFYFFCKQQKANASDWQERLPDPHCHASATNAQGCREFLRAWKANWTWLGTGFVFGFLFPEDFVSLPFISHIISRLEREGKISVCCSFDFFFFKRNSLLPSKGIDMVDHASEGDVSSFFFSSPQCWAPLSRCRKPVSS